MQLTNDIDLSTVCSATLDSWVPIGATDTYFAGTFDGNYYKIKNLYINNDQYSYAGLFSETTNSTIIKNIIIENVNINITNICMKVNKVTGVGGIVGGDNGTVLNCGIESGSISGSNESTDTRYYIPVIVGGIIGWKDNGIIKNCYNKASINANAAITGRGQIITGGVLGGSAVTVENCYNTGKIIGKAYDIYIGGISGLLRKNNSSDYGYIKNCYNLGTITFSGYTQKYAGGVVGRNGNKSTQPMLTYSNNYCTTEINVSQTYWNGSKFVAYTAGRVSPTENLKTYANTLGANNWVTDTYGINNGYPILRWQLPSFELNVKQTYMKVGGDSKFIIKYIKNTKNNNNRRYYLDKLR